MSKVDKKNEVSWEKLFKLHGIVSEINKNGFFIIKSSQINEFRESRLMTKFDNSHQLPAVFKKNKIGILPISRGSYVLGRFNIFHKFDEPPVEIANINFQNIFQSLDFNAINTESLAISCAFVAGILNDFVGESLTPTISGRMGTHVFQYELKDDSGLNRTIAVDKAQIEIDGGFEGEKSLVLIEAKNYISDDFVIRQVYYPFRKWEDSIEKPIRNIYLTYSNGIFDLREYGFSKVEEYQSIYQVNAKQYSIYQSEFNLQILKDLIKTSKIVTESKNVPFPQADLFDRVINLCEILASVDGLTKKDITENYGFDKRQSDYYFNACRYLGLAELIVSDKKRLCTLTDLGKNIFNKNIDIRRVELVKLMLSKIVFRETIQLYLENHLAPSIQQISAIVNKSQLSNNYAGSTVFRRSKTVQSWVNWVLSQLDE